MIRREDALKEALKSNEIEIQRWQMFLKENETAVENMINFSKRLTVDVMVPIGKKALMPGHLLHTNELLVAHYQGYFSKCTTLKAKEICEYRIKMAKENLTKLEVEANLWQNKLDKPNTEGVIPGGEEQEIIEEFNEESEKIWMQEHRVRLKQAKQKEREDREYLLTQRCKVSSKDNTNDEMIKILEEAELLQELEQELNTLEIEEVNDETVRKLMSGELKLPKGKRRHQHVKDAHNEHNNLEKSLPPNIVKAKAMNSDTCLRTNNNVLPNQEISLTDTLTEADEVNGETLSEEVALIRKQAQYLIAVDQIGFYDYHIQIIRQKLQRLPLRTPQELDEKIHLLGVLENLEELLEEVEESVGEEELAVKSRDTNNEEKCNNSNDRLVESTLNGSNVENRLTQKRRISFALDDQCLEFRNHEAVTQMIPSKIEKHERDIKLNYIDQQKNKCYSNKVDNFDNKQLLIQEKVNKNLQYMAENQSKQDFNLVQKILECSIGDINTLYIKFQHSEKHFYASKEIKDTIGSPADIYNLFKISQHSSEKKSSTIFINSYEGEEFVKAPVLKEADRKTAFADQKSEFSNPQVKSILKNKSAVGKETYRKLNNNDVSISVYDKVMNDVIEKPLTEPEALPDVKFIDTHTPKKRISRFKQMRQENGNT